MKAIREMPRSDRRSFDLFIAPFLSLPFRRSSVLACPSVRLLSVENRYTQLGRTGHIVLVYVFAVIVLPFLGLLAQLLGFHVMLSESLEGVPRTSTFRPLHRRVFFVE